MKKFKSIIVAAAIMLGAPAAMAASYGETPQETAIVIACLAIAVFAIGHMLYVLIFRRKLPTDLTPVYFRERRLAAGKPENATAEEIELAAEGLRQAVSKWRDFYAEDGSEGSLPLSRPTVNGTVAAWKAARDLMPTDTDVVQLMNDTADVLNGMRARTFTGSKTMLVVAWVLTLLMGYIGENILQVCVFTGINTVLYVMSTMKPDYVLYRKMVEGKTEKSFLSGMLGGLFGAVAAAKTYKTVIQYSDGRTETETDNSETWISLAFAFVVMVFLTFFLFVVSFFNYLRNYVFS